MQMLLQSTTGETEETATVRRGPHRAAIEFAKGSRSKPLVLEHMDVAAAAEMPRPAFEAQLTGWVKELLAEDQDPAQLSPTQLVEISDRRQGLGPLEPLMSDETVDRHHGQRAEARFTSNARASWS